MAVLATIACTDEPTSTEAPRQVTAPTKPVLDVGPIRPTVLYVGTFADSMIVENVLITSVADGEIVNGNFAQVEAGSGITMTGHYRILSGSTNCFTCVHHAYLGWITNISDTASYRLFPEYTHDLRAYLTTGPVEGDFTWTTTAPAIPGTYLIGGAQGVRNLFYGATLGSDPDDLTSGARWASFQIAVTEPVIIPTVQGTLGGGGWYTSDVTVSWDVRTVEAQVQSKTGCDPVTISADSPAETVTCSVVAAGETKSKSVTVKRDATKPGVSINVTPAANLNGWNNGAVTVNWTCTDGGSGPQAANGSKAVSAEGSNQSVDATCIDVAGNNATATQSGINIDLTPPTLDPKVSADTFALNAVGSATPNASDALSGLGAASCNPVITSVAGNFTINCTATDKAGNSATKSVSYFVKSPYNFGGFQSPIGGSNSLNSANAGSVVPLKFSVGGYKGLDILAAGSPSSKSLTCPLSAPVNTILSASKLASGTTTLTYDARTNTYTYTWKTEKSWAGTCRTLVLALKDGLEHTADFQFTK